MKILPILALVVATAVAKPALNQVQAASCVVCHPVDDTKINIHLVPHSHDDVGWLKTVDQYFYGLKTNIQRAGVQYIITTAVESLRRNPDRRYVQVETAFFRKWWNEARETLRQDFIDLVNAGQIEMINGAISMNDEACTNYQSTIDQYTWGLRFLNESLGSCGVPRIGWQIDPFGHSREQASIFSQLGFEGFYFSRLDENDKTNRKKNKQMDFLWRGSANLDNTDIFGSIFPTGLYFPPNDLHWDVGDSDDAVVLDQESPDYNVPKFLESIKNTVNEYKDWYPTNNILFPMGGDFQYQSADMQFMNMDRIVEIFKNDSAINVIYSTPTCYLRAVNAAKPTLKLKTDDFFPYGNSDHEYWAGYFTSRPNSKRFERQGNNILQAVKQLTALAKILKKVDHTGDLNDLREEMGIMQHHDAITGTEKQHVTSDYVRRLNKGVTIAESHLDEVVGALLAKDNVASLDIDLKSCLLSNVTICHTNTGSNVIVVYNPLSKQVNQYIRVPVPEGSYKLIAPNLDETDFAVVTPISTFSYVNLTEGKPYSTELVIEVRKIPPLGAKVFILEITDSNEIKKETRPAPKATLKYGNDVAGFELDDKTNLLKSVTIDGKTLDISQEFLYYQSANETIWSGAYLFRPQPKTVAISLSDKVTIETVTTTDQVDEVVQVYNDYIRQIIRAYKGDGQNYIEFDWLVGPLPDESIAGTGREIISRFTVNKLANNGTFYTDSNGRELIKRELNKRPDYTYDSTIEPIASNYYPVTSRILLRDDKQNLEVALLNDRSQAGSSLGEGQLELMVHRRLFHDDYKGVDENLNETEFGQGVVVRGTHYLTFGDIVPASGGQSAASIERQLALKKLLAPVVLIGNTAQTTAQITAKFNLKIESIATDLPDNVNVMTFEPWTDNSYILRLENIFEKDEDSTLSADVSVDLNAIFTDIQFSSIKETTLGANQWLDAFHRQPKFTWTSTQGQTEGYSVDTSKDAASTVTLSPMQIRTFIVKV